MTWGYYNLGKNQRPYAIRLEELLNENEEGKKYLVMESGKNGETTESMKQRIKKLEHVEQASMYLILGIFLAFFFSIFLK